MTKRGRKRGRPADPTGQIQRLEGDAGAKHRLTLLLDTLSGQRSVDAACAELGLSPSRFFALRQAVLRAALTALSPRPRGRPATPPEAGERERALEAQLAILEEELQCALVRTELALAMPRLLKRAAEKKERAARPAERPSRRGPRPPLAAPPGPGETDAPPAR